MALARGTAFARCIVFILGMIAELLLRETCGCWNAGARLAAEEFGAVLAIPAPDELRQFSRGAVDATVLREVRDPFHVFTPEALRAFAANA